MHVRDVALNLWHGSTGRTYSNRATESTTALSKPVKKDFWSVALHLRLDYSLRIAYVSRDRVSDLLVEYGENGQLFCLEALPPRDCRQNHIAVASLQLQLLQRVRLRLRLDHYFKMPM